MSVLTTLDTWPIDGPASDNRPHISVAFFLVVWNLYDASFPGPPSATTRLQFKDGTLGCAFCAAGTLIAGGSLNQNTWAAGSATSAQPSNFVKHANSAAHKGWVKKLTRNSDDVADHVAPSSQELLEVLLKPMGSDVSEMAICVGINELALGVQHPRLQRIEPPTQSKGASTGPQESNFRSIHELRIPNISHHEGFWVCLRRGMTWRAGGRSTPPPPPHPRPARRTPPPGSHAKGPSIIVSVM